MGYTLGKVRARAAEAESQARRFKRYATEWTATARRMERTLRERLAGATGYGIVWVGANAERPTLDRIVSALKKRRIGCLDFIIDPSTIGVGVSDPDRYDEAEAVADELDPN